MNPPFRFRLSQKLQRINRQSPEGNTIDVSGFQTDSRRSVKPEQRLARREQSRKEGKTVEGGDERE